jgi:hypothetical protein
VIVIDVEASGLATESYPIEIAWQDSEDPANFDSFLITPHPEWKHWDDYAEQEIHHISRNILFENGISLFEACDRLNTKLSGQTVYSDAVDYDLNWIMTLFETSRIKPTFEICSIFDLLPDQAELKYESLVGEQVIVHRALEDARQIVRLCAQISRV